MIETFKDFPQYDKQVLSPSFQSRCRSSTFPALRYLMSDYEYICPICNQHWKTGQKSIECASCKSWVHRWVHRSMLILSEIYDFYSVFHILCMSKTNQRFFIKPTCHLRPPNFSYPIIFILGTQYLVKGNVEYLVKGNVELLTIDFDSRNQIIFILSTQYLVKGNVE